VKRVVIDTNVLVSAAITPHGNPSKILMMFTDGHINLHFCTEMITEYSRVLAYSKFDLSDQAQAAIILDIISKGIPVTPKVSTIPLTHESDRVFYDTAKTSNSILVTGNIKHYPNEPMIMTPTDFIALFTKPDIM